MNIFVAIFIYLFFLSGICSYKQNISSHSLTILPQGGGGNKILKLCYRVRNVILDRFEQVDILQAPTMRLFGNPTHKFILIIVHCHCSCHYR